MMELLHSWILTALIGLPIVGSLAVAATRAAGHEEAEAVRIRRKALSWSVATLVLMIAAVVLFFDAKDETGAPVSRVGTYGLVQDFSWINDTPISPESPMRLSGYIDFRYHVGVDGLSVWLVALTAGLVPLCILGSYTGIRTRLREYYALMLLLEAGMIGVFCARDLLLFYIFFEFTLIPLFFIIGIWGGPQRRYAAAKFFLYTFTGSMLTFAGVLYLAYQAYILPASLGGVGKFTFDLDTLYGLELSYRAQWWLFLAFAAGFGVKVPLFPLHTWLPLAHTEAPTAGSVLLAGVLLKLGTYGFLRFSLPMLPEASMTFAPYMAILAIVGIIYAALAAWVQEDIKKLVAYSSVSHLGACILGMFSMTDAGVTGSLMYMVNHGLSTGALFLVVGMIYERYHTREFRRLGGLARRMPWMTFFLVFFSLSSIALPGLNGFVSEFLVLLGTFTSNRAGDMPAGPLGPIYAAFAAIGVILGAVYILAMCQRVLFGPLVEPPGTPDEGHGLTPDLTRREIGILVPIAAACLFIGVYPRPVLTPIQVAAQTQVLDRVHDGLGGPADDVESVFVREDILPRASGDEYASATKGGLR